MLKITKVELELSDPEMYLMIEKGIRGVVSMITKSHAKANNPYMKEKYNPEEENIYLPYLDANNLYGWAMSKLLPVKDFKWMTNEELSITKHTTENWKNCETGGIPCILEVDLEYPQDLHDLHNDYPLAPERLKVGNYEAGGVEK